MLFNKNEVRKASEKKVLHKSGKNWIVLSSALLLALAGGAAVSHVSANADSSNNNAQSEANFVNNVDANSTINAKNNSTIHSLVNYNLVNPNAQASASTKSASASTNSKANSQWYWNWNGGSAQSYYAQANKDNKTASANSKLVNSYVNSVNAKFPTQTKSLSSNLGSAQAKLNNDKSLATSYSAMAHNSNYSNEVSSLAASAGMTRSAYVQSVEFQASNYNSNVSADSMITSEMNSVNSYATELQSIHDGGSAIHAEYSNAAASADAAESDASTVYSDAEDNVSAYNEAVANSKANVLNEQAALDDSVADAGVVKSIADKFGEPSSVVSSAVRSLANRANPIQTSSASFDNKQDASAFKNDHDTISTSTAANGDIYVNVESVNYGSGANNNFFSNGHYDVSHNDPAFVRVVKNTSAMYAYSANKANYNRVIARYNSASANVTSASVAYSDAVSNANYYDTLNSAANTANNPLDYIFGTNGVKSSLMNRHDNQAAIDYMAVRDGFTTNQAGHRVAQKIVKAAKAGVKLSSNDRSVLINSLHDLQRDPSNSNVLSVAKNMVNNITDLPKLTTALNKFIAEYSAVKPSNNNHSNAENNNAENNSTDVHATLEALMGKFLNLNSANSAKLDAGIAQIRKDGKLTTADGFNPDIANDLNKLAAEFGNTKLGHAISNMVGKYGYINGNRFNHFYDATATTITTKAGTTSNKPDGLASTNTMLYPFIGNVLDSLNDMEAEAASDKGKAQNVILSGINNIKAASNDVPVYSGNSAVPVYRALLNLTTNLQTAGDVADASTVYNLYNGSSALIDKTTKEWKPRTAALITPASVINELTALENDPEENGNSTSGLDTFDNPFVDKLTKSAAKIVANDSQFTTYNSGNNKYYNTKVVNDLNSLANEFDGPLHSDILGMIGTNGYVTASGVLNTYNNASSTTVTTPFSGGAYNTKNSAQVYPTYESVINSLQKLSDNLSIPDNTAETEFKGEVANAINAINNSDHKYDTVYNIVEPVLRGSVGQRVADGSNGEIEAERPEYTTDQKDLTNVESILSSTPGPWSSNPSANSNHKFNLSTYAPVSVTDIANELDALAKDPSRVDNNQDHYNNVVDYTTQQNTIADNISNPDVTLIRSAINVVNSSDNYSNVASALTALKGMVSGKLDENDSYIFNNAINELNNGKSVDAPLVKAASNSTSEASGLEAIIKQALGLSGTSNNSQPSNNSKPSNNNNNQPSNNNAAANNNNQSVANDDDNVVYDFDLNANDISSEASAAASDYTAESAASASYASTTDANYALAGYYAASYAGDINGDQAAVSSASEAYNNFYSSRIGSAYASAAYEASTASSNAVNDEALAKAYGINVYNNAPKYVTVLKNARIHSATDFGSKGDKVLGTAHAGKEYTVEGIGLDTHGALRYTVYDNGNYGFLSGNANYVRNTFLPAQNNISIVVNRPVKVYSDANFSHYTGKKIAANTQLPVSVIRMDNFNNGFTRVKLANGNYISANTGYIAKVADYDASNNNLNTGSKAPSTYDNQSMPIEWGNI